MAGTVRMETQSKIILPVSEGRRISNRDLRTCNDLPAKFGQCRRDRHTLTDPPDHGLKSSHRMIIQPWNQKASYDFIDRRHPHRGHDTDTNSRPYEPLFLPISSDLVFLFRFLPITDHITHETPSRGYFIPAQAAEEPESAWFTLDNQVHFGYNIPAIGVWRSLVSRLVRVQEASGSNPDTPTKDSQNRRGDSGWSF